MFITDTFDAFVQDACQYFPLTVHQFATELPKTPFGKAIIHRLRNLSAEQRDTAQITAQVAALFLTLLLLPNQTTLLVEVMVGCISAAVARRAYLHFDAIAQREQALHDADNID